MGNYFKTIYIFAITQLKRLFRDPVTILILMGLPVALLLIFGSLSQGDGSINLRTAIINNSNTQFAEDFEKNLKNMDVLKVSDDEPTLDAAKERMGKSELDTIIEIPKNFGQTNEKGTPSGKLIVYHDKNNQQTSQIVDAITNGIVDGYNEQLIGKQEVPIAIDLAEISSTSSQIKSIHYVLAIFGGMALLMVGIFGIALAIPADKKAGILRRLHVTPLKASQAHLGTMLSFAVIGSIVMAIMTGLAIALYGLEIKGDILSFIIFTLLSLVLSLGFGLAIAGVVKNTSQAEIIGQIVFLASLALSGLWVPIALMPEVLQNIAAFAPLSLIVEGMQRITGEGVSLASLLREIAIITGWIIVVYSVGIKTFRWE